MTTLRAIHVPALRIALLFSAGILAGSAVPASAGPIVAGLLLVSSLLLFGFLLAHRRGWTSILAATVCVLVGIMKIGGDRRTPEPLPELLPGNPCIAVGRIVDPPTSVGRRIRCTLALERVRWRGGEKRVDEHAAITILRSTRDTVPLQIEYGMRIAVSGELTRPPPERNPGEFSTRVYYDANGITAAVFVRGYAGIIVLDSAGGSWIMRRCVVPVRRFVLSEMDRTLGTEEGEFLKGLVVGERSGIPVTTRQAFVNAGVAHVLAVSGSNVAVVASVLVLAIGFLRFPRWLSTSAVACALLFYMMLTGNQPPVVRATIMALVLLLGRIGQKRTNAYNLLGVSALIILGIDARQLFDVGFQLSYGAVFSIVFFYPKLNGWIGHIGGGGRIVRALRWLLRLSAVSVAATLGTLPLTAVAFGRVSVIGILANLIVIPATSLSVILGIVSTAAAVVHPWIGSVYAAVNGIVLHWTLWVTEVCGNAPCAYLDTVWFRPVHALPYFALLSAGVVIDRPQIARRALIVLLAALDTALLWPVPFALARTPGVLRLSVIDVGEGDAILVEFPRGETMLVDAGPAGPSGNAGEAVVGPFLRRKGISSLDLLVVSHPHADHLGGASWIIGHVPIRRVVESGQTEPSGLYAAFRAAASRAGVEPRIVRGGDTISIAGDVRVYILAPGDAYVRRDSADGHLNLNNSSVVLRILYGSTSILLAGDAEREVEERIVHQYGDGFCSTLLKLAHHGSSTGSSESFLAAVRPAVGVISVGRNNTFRHPSASVLRRCEEMGIPLLRTDEEGALMFESDGTMLRAVDWR